MLSKPAPDGGRTDSPERSDRVSSCSGPPSRRARAVWSFRRPQARERAMPLPASLRAGRRSPSLDSSNTVPEFLQPPVIRRLASCEAASYVHATGVPTSSQPDHRSRPFWPSTYSTLFPVGQVLNGIVRRDDDRVQWRPRTGQKRVFHGRSTPFQRGPIGRTIRKLSFLSPRAGCFRRLIDRRERGPA